MAAGQARQSPSARLVEDGSERVVQGRHGVHGAHRTLPAQPLQGVEVGALGADGHGRQLEVERGREHLEPRVGQRVHGDDVSRAQGRHQGDGQPVLGAADQEDLVGPGRHAPAGEVRRDGRAVRRTAGVGLVAQQRVEVARARDLAQRPAQQVGLVRDGVVVEQMSTLEEACEADAVVVGSGVATREVVEDARLMGVLRRLDPSRQLVAAQCSGALVLARLGLLGDVPACTDLTTRPWVVAAGVEVLDQPFFARDGLATAGGCLASPYLAAWVIARLRGTRQAGAALHYVAPVGEKEEYVERAWRAIAPYLPAVACPSAS